MYCSAINNNVYILLLNRNHLFKSIQQFDVSDPGLFLRRNSSSDSKSGVPVFPVEQRSPDHASLEDGRQGDDGDQGRLELHEDEEDEGGPQELLQRPPEALEREHVDPEDEEDPGHDEDGDEHGEGREDVPPEAAEDGGGKVGVLVTARALPGPESAPEPLGAVVFVGPGRRRRRVGPLPSPCSRPVGRRGSAGPLVTVDHVCQHVPQEVARLLAAHVVHFLPAVRAVDALRRPHHLLEQIREARVQVSVAVAVAGVVVVVVAGISFLSSLSVRRAHDAVDVLLLYFSEILSRAKSRSCSSSYSVMRTDGERCSALS